MIKFPIACVLTIGIIIFVEIMFIATSEPLTGLPYFEPTGDDGMIVTKRRLMSQAKGKWIIIGDSSSLTGIDPNILSEELGVEFLNLSTLSSFSTVGYTDMAAETLRRHDINGIIYGVLPQTLELSREHVENFGLLDRYHAAYGLDTVEERSTLKSKFHLFIRKHKYNTFPPQFASSFSEFYEKLLESSGFREERRKLRTFKTKTEFSPQSYSTEPIVLLQRKAKEKQIPLLLLINPKPISGQSDLYLTQVNDFLKTFRTNNSSLLMIDQNYEPWPDSYFGTVTHLNREGATRYSRQLAKFIRTYLGR